MARAGLTRVSTTELQRELHRRSRNLPKLMRKREQLLGKVAEIEAIINSLGGPAGGSRVALPPGRKRPKNDSNLVEALYELLKGKTMSVTDATEAVQQAGYKTTSKTFRTIVNQTLINSGKFKRVSRGQYTSK